MAVKPLPRPERRVNPRSLTPEERAWLEVWTPATRRSLQEGLAQLNVSRRITWALLEYMDARHEGQFCDVVSNRTRANYRNVLRALADAGVPTPGGKTPIMPVRSLFRKAAA